MKPHPNLSDEINATLDFFDGEGISIKDLEEGDVLEVQTQNTLYTLRVLDPSKQLVYVTSTHPNWPDLGEQILYGSNFGGSMLKMGWVCGGTYMELGRKLMSQTKTVALVKKTEKQP